MSNNDDSKSSAISTVTIRNANEQIISTLYGCFNIFIYLLTDQRINRFKNTGLRAKDNMIIIVNKLNLL